MTSARLNSTTERHAQPASERLPAIGEPRRVEAAEALTGDRRRSLREELSEAENDVGGQARENAHRVVAQLTELPPEEQARLSKPLSSNGFSVVDEQA